MKVKTDFITNSSSASFILYVNCEAKTLNEFIKLWNKYIDYYIEINSESLDKKVEKYKDATKKHIKSKKELEEKIEKGEADKRDELFYDLIYKHFDEKASLLATDDQIKRTLLGEMNFDIKFENFFTVTHDTSMYNDFFQDVPDWMLYLIYRETNLKKFDINKVKIEVVDTH
jgi:glycerophosphoryl diester phosphodiesterase